MRRVLEAVAKIMVRRRAWDMSWYFETRRLNEREPAMTDPMKQANIRPSGKSGDWASVWAAVSAGVQKNTKRYMLPSKKQDARPRVRMRLSVKKVLRASFGGVDVGNEEWLSP